MTGRQQRSIDRLYDMIAAARPVRRRKKAADAGPDVRKIIAPSFFDVYDDVLAGAHTYYKLPGGRGSTKSSFVSVAIVDGIMRDGKTGKLTNAVVYRRWANALQGSVYEQLLWAIDSLGATDEWQSKLSPLRLVYKPTGQQIIFKGADLATKSKSIKVAKGYIKYCWFEELSEFEGPEKIRSIQQSILRGGPEFRVFYSFNPPRSQKNWVNDPTAFDQPGMLEKKTTYLTVPREWLGPQFLLDAEHLKEVKPDAYEHEYMGVATGTGGEVFGNVVVRELAAADIDTLPRRRYGIDWGYATDPFVFLSMGYDRRRRHLIIYDEVCQAGLSNLAASEKVKEHGGLGRDIVADSAEPKSIADMRSYGLRVRPSVKGPDSVKHGIEWLTGLEEIVIDKRRCPNAAREFVGYELARDARGELKAEYPDKDNHTIDACRYGMEDDMENSGTKF